MEEIPPPLVNDPSLSELVPVLDEDGVPISFTFTLQVEWSFSDEATPTIRKRETVRESNMVVSQFAIVIGLQPIEGVYGDVPVDSLLRIIAVMICLISETVFK